MMNLKDSSGLAQIKDDMEYYCLTVGQRIAGSPQEKEAADYTVRRFRELGMTNVAALPFSCKRWLPGGGELTVLEGDGRTVKCVVVAHSVPTPQEGVEGELAIFEPADWEEGLRRTDLAGKIGLFHGGYGESAEVFEQLQNSPLAALIFVDTRLQTDWPVANGVGEKFMRLLRKPMAYISLMDAWALARERVRRVRLTCRGEVSDATSWNVVGELPGSDHAGEVIVLCGHIDSVAVGYGADDNASGMAAVLECARRLKDTRRIRTLRFVGFGAEEQLSLGSMRYVEEQVQDLERVGFACNFDGIAAWLGHSEVMVTGTAALEEYVRSMVEEKQVFGRVRADASPYQDGFPFSACGIPSIWFTRKTHLGAYWYHHSEHNTLEVCSMEQIAWTAETACGIVGELAASDSWPFERRISPTIQEKIDRYRRELFE